MAFPLPWVSWPAGFVRFSVILASATPLSDMVSAKTTAVTNNTMRFLIFSTLLPSRQSENRPTSFAEIAGCATGSPVPLTAAPVSIDPYVVASRHETVFEGSQVKGARRRRCRDAQGGGREDLLCVDAHHKALDKEASRDRGRGARADPRQALQERSDA